MVLIPHTVTPQVLLLGNGLTIPSKGLTWKKLIKTISVREDLPEEMTCPEPLQAILATNDNIKDAMKEHQKDFMGEVSPSLQNQLQTLLSLNFDDILTTNYSYEIEAAAAGKTSLSEYFLKKTCKNTEEGKRAQAKYLLQTYQQIEYNGHLNRIWHIHGEARKPDSMILGHYYYAAQLNKIIELLHGRKDIYLTNHMMRSLKHSQAGLAASSSAMYIF